MSTFQAICCNEGSNKDDAPGLYTPAPGLAAVAQTNRIEKSEQRLIEIKALPIETSLTQLLDK